MRILIIANSESVHTARFANEFVKRGHIVLLLSATEYLGRIVKYHEDVKHIRFCKGITHLWIKLFRKRIAKFNPAISKPYHPLNFLILLRMIHLFFFINRVVKKYEFDAVFAINLTTNGLFAARIKRKVSKVCLTIGCDLRLAKWYTFNYIINNPIVFKYVDKKMDYLITYNDDEIKTFFKKSFFKHADKLKYINGLGVDTNSFNPEFKNGSTKKELYNIPKNAILGLCFRQPRPGLDFKTIILKLEKVIREKPNFYFAIGTGGIDQPELKKLVKELNVENNIRFIGNVDYKKLHHYIAQGDIFIDPINLKKYPEKKSTGPSGALLESMACGLIPVISNRPGVEFYFDTDLLKKLIYNDMEDDLARYVLLAIDNIDNQKLHHELRDVIIKRSSWISTVELTEKLFQK